MNILTLILAALLGVTPAGKAFLEPLHPRDSILIADQLRYGLQLDDVAPGTGLALADLSPFSNDTLTFLGGWQADTLIDGKHASRKAIAKALKEGKPLSIRTWITVAPFEEGRYILPDLPVVKVTGGKADTLLFEGLEMEVKTMPVDTNTFVINDIKGQTEYPLTMAELAPWIAGLALLSAALVLGTLLIISLSRRRKEKESGYVEPDYIIALRALDRYRSDKYWAPDKQKQFYSGITDTLRAYMDSRFGVDAPEMTTAEIFDALKNDPDLTPELYTEAKELFELADFVKFAKHTASDEDNAKALPAAVRFVTGTYRIDTVEESGEEAAEK